MSRTDKDAPYWARCEWYEPYHYCTQHHSRAWQRFGHLCDLPPEPVIERTQTWRWRGHCHWVPVWGPKPYGRNWRGGHPPNWYVDHVWNSRIRTLVRGQLRRAAAEHRAAGTTDVTPNIDQHRHGARWYWD